MGRSNCATARQPESGLIIDLPPWVDPSSVEAPSEEMTSFYCDMTDEPWITEEGWIELLQMYVSASSIPEGSDLTWEVVWLYAPDYNR